MVASMRRALVVYHDYGDSLGVLADPLLEIGCATQYWCPIREAEPPARSDYWDLVIGLGGASNPRDPIDALWHAQEIAYYQELLEREVPLLAICLSAQLLAVGLGARTWRLADPEIGPVTLKGSWPLPDSHNVLQWHSFAFETPKGAVEVAKGPEGSCAAFSYRSAFATQFHIEANEDIFKTWMLENRASMAESDCAVLRSDVQQHASDIEDNCAMIARRWLAVQLQASDAA
jgi:GMP synthase (glutamine-hydrolysing)